jgi:ankyrin repeat protein
MTPSELSADLQRFETMLEHWRQFIKQLAEIVPKQLDIRDLKGQTPLMLAAEDGDTELVLTMLKAGADPDIQPESVKMDKNSAPTSS